MIFVKIFWYFKDGSQRKLFTEKVIRHNPLLPGLPVQSLPDLNHNRSDHNTQNNGALVHNKRSLNQLLLHDVIAYPANWHPF